MKYSEFESHSTRVRGLKSVTIDEVLNKHVVALYTSAWIEICGTIGT